MNLFSFISKIVESTAWPIVFLILGIIFRKSIKELLPFIRKIKAGPVEAEFDAEARKLIEESKEVLATTQTNKKKATSDEEQDDIALAKIYITKKDPSKMVLDGWNNVDGALFRLGRDAGSIVDPMDSINSVYRTVIATDLLDTKTKKLVVEVFEMRNRVALANLTPSPDAAQNYILAVEQVVKLIEKQREKLEAKHDKNTQ